MSKTSSFYLNLALSALLISSLLFLPNIEAAKKKRASRKIKNVILMIGDGMGHNQLHITEVLRKKKLFLLTLDTIGIVSTTSNDSLVTDSAAAATALATGHKTNNQVVGKNTNFNNKKTLLEAFKAQGKKTALITNDAIVEATPAAFGSHVKSRKNSKKVIEWYLKNKVDILMGGGRKHFTAKNLDQYRKADYHIAFSADDLPMVNEKKHKRLLGLFNDGHMNFAIDRKHLSEMRKEPKLK
jgi:alkaline phosphatase